MKQQDLIYEHGTLNPPVNSGPQGPVESSEIERQRRENEQLKTENQGLRGQLVTQQTYKEAI